MVRAAAAELVGTLVLVLVALVGALGHTSGCHLNPAVSLGLASIGKFPWRYVPVYIVAQMVGAVLAGFALWGAYGSQARTVAQLGATAPTPGSSDLQAFFMEVCSSGSGSGWCW